MTSGKPLSEREKAFIAQWADEQFPTVIARHLAIHYSDDNGGSRSTQTVRNYIQELKDQKQKGARKPKPTS
jgi:hypothetical protein